MSEIKYPKHFLVIKDIVYNIGDDIIITEDLDKVPMQMDFTLPFIKDGNLDTTNIRKYDAVKLYFKFFRTARERDTATIDSTHLVFDGYIDRLENTENKLGGDVYNIKCISTAGLMYERGTLVPTFTGTIPMICEQLLDQGNMLNYFPTLHIEGFSENFVAKIDSNKFLGKVFDQMKEKYAMYIFQAPNGDLWITLPSWFGTQQTIKVYDLKENIFDMNYGEITQNVDTVVCFGAGNVFGAAFDPISYQLKTGADPTNLQTTVTPQRELMSELYIYRRDLLGSEDCQTVAKEKLVELSKNYSVSFTTEFDPEQKIGDIIVINNSKKISPSQKWIIKSRETSIGKSNITTSITCYSNSIQDLPTDMLTSNVLGLLDTDTYEITEKLENEVQLH